MRFQRFYKSHKLVFDLAKYANILICQKIKIRIFNILPENVYVNNGKYSAFL